MASQGGILLCFGKTKAGGHGKPGNLTSNGLDQGLELLVPVEIKKQNQYISFLNADQLLFFQALKQPAKKTFRMAKKKFV
ncbi:MAG: hypothetical protein PVG52_13670 [Desulfobacterales bacterium]